MIRSLELFCGTGGLALGLHQAGFEPKALIEWDKVSCDNIKANIARGYSGIGGWNVIQTDVRLVRYSDFGADIQFVTGGPPCQPFSLGGKHKAHADARDMFPEAVRAVRELRPQGFVFENVKGLLRKSFSSYFSYILLQLSHPEVEKKDGMDWIGHLKRLEEYHTSKSQRGLDYNVVFRHPKQRWRTVRDALAGLPDPQSDSASKFVNHEYRGGARPYAGHSGSVLDEPSKTIKAGAHGVPGGENMIVLDDGALRYYTVRESARIQTFPDEYHFHGSWTESMRQIGNAVPVKLATVIGSSIAEQLERAKVKNGKKECAALRTV